MRWLWGVILVLSLGQTARAQVDYAREVLPILAEHCFACHGPDAESRQADLRLDDRASAEPVLGAAGTLRERILSHDADQQMPPPEGKPLSEAAKGTLVRWLEEGAAYGTHWAFRPPQRPPLPAVRQRAWPRNPIDYFILARLEEVGLSPSAPAAAETLVRRLALDLTGLPPTPADVAAFVREKELERAVARQADVYLSSPRYGERMAGPWLDVARYADTDGYQNDRYRYQHVWRDWVILAFNENMPYDQFVVEQLAGDMLPGATFRQQVATGFCRNHRINSEDGSIPAEWHVENVVDRVDTLGTALWGLTVGCARCHDHKYDPLTQREYYQLFAYFNNVPEWGVGPNNGNSPPFVEVPKSWPHLSAAENTAQLPDPVRLRPSRENNAGNGLKRPQAGPPNTVMVMAELPEPRETYRLIRGQYNTPDRSERLAPAVPSFLAGDVTPRSRLELAHWIVSDEHPLTARVAVNRLWQELFGVGLVATSENFGVQGERPSHPELLDWLAVSLIESGWDMQAVLRLMVNSATYQQAAVATPEKLAQDPGNRLLSRGPRFRLSPFALRDQALAVSGLLHEQLGGVSVKPYMPPKIWRAISNNSYQQDGGANLYRRSLYTYWRRTIPPPTMMSFNAAAREVCVVRTQRTNTPLQALTLMNNVTFVEAARFLGERMLREASTDEGRVAIAFRSLTARRPSEGEMDSLLAAYAAFRRDFSEDASSAKQLLAMGEGKRDARLPVVEHASATLVASLILNLDEVVTKE